MILFPLLYFLEFILISQLDRFSKVISLNMTQKNVVFSEISGKRRGKIKWNKNILFTKFKLIPNKIKKEMEELDTFGQKIYKNRIKRLQQEICEISRRGITTYLTVDKLKFLLNSLFEENCLIIFYIRKEIPIKIQVEFKSLDNTVGYFFLAQRKIIKSQQ